MSGRSEQTSTDALISEARKELRRYRVRSRNFNPPVGDAGRLVDLIERLTATLVAVRG